MHSNLVSSSENYILSRGLLGNIYGTLFSSISMAVINYFNQKQVREGRDSFLFPDCNPSLRQGTQAGT